MDFKNVAKKYRPVPFWSWNEKLNKEETERQVKVMDDAGIGGFFMHARTGLQTEYLGEEWFSNVTAAKDKAKECGMYAWAYDENGWPSGFGNGVVTELGAEYQQKLLVMSDTDKGSDNFIAKCGNHWFYYSVNRFYVDVLDKKAVRKFIETAYEPYYERYKTELEGFFTDEPQLGLSGIRWSFVLEEEYFKRYGESLKEHLEELFIDIGDYKKQRVRYWKLVTDLFSESYFKQIYDWCEERNLKLTGHLLLEETMETQACSSGACMPHYEYFHIPGMDWLGRKTNDVLTMKQVSSVAEQLGKKNVLTETYAACGNSMSFAEMKGLYEWQTVRGINLLCPHLEGYSMRGMRKRDYPPLIFYQQPWWKEFKKFTDTISRESMILAEGEKKVDVLVIHPQTTAWTMYNSIGRDRIRRLDDEFKKVIKSLEHKHIQFHLGDETIMERHAKVEGEKLVIGKQKYSFVITSCCETLLESTEMLLKEFEGNGGRIITAEDLPKNNVCDNENITYMKCEYPEFTVHFFVNSSANYEKSQINADGKMLDLSNGEMKKFCRDYEFEPYGSLMVIDDGKKDGFLDKKDYKIISPSQEFHIDEITENILTLDRCDYWFDGVLQEKNGYILNIVERASDLEKKVKIRWEFKPNIEYIPEDISLVCETPEKFKIKINGKNLDTNAFCDYFLDVNFKKINIAEYVSIGENTISFECDYEQSPDFYKRRRNAFKSYVEKNKLTYETEIEAIYLTGGFSVDTEGKWESLENDAIRYSGDFKIVTPKKEYKADKLEKQGLPFFAGTLKLSGKINISGENPIMKIKRKNVNVVKVEINGIEKTYLTDEIIELDDFGVTGETEIKITLINNLRNMLGPHHLKMGECFDVAVGAFYKEACVWIPDPDKYWDDDYCFANFGIEFLCER